MNLQSTSNSEYKIWFSELKARIRSVQIKAAITVNSSLIEFYWELGKMIAEKENVWGSKLIEQTATDLKAEFPDMKGFSISNLKYCKSFYLFYSKAISQQAVDQLQLSNILLDDKPIQQTFITKSQQLVGQIPWGHNILIFSKSKTICEAIFYIENTIENNWSRDTLAFQMKSDLYNRQGKSINNFRQTLPEPSSDLAQQTLKDPYIFDFLALSQLYKEKDIENQLIQHITKFLLELGKGFAFIGKQYCLEIADKDYYLDLLFYHTRLKCYVVIELKNTGFIPEYAGKLNFYLSAVDSILKQEDDKPSIGILLCRDKNNIEAEFALRDIGKPMGISEFQLTGILPNDLKTNLPSIEEIVNEINNFD